MPAAPKRYAGCRVTHIFYDRNRSHAKHACSKKRDARVIVVLSMFVSPAHGHLWSRNLETQHRLRNVVLILGCCEFNLRLSLLKLRLA